MRDETVSNAMWLVGFLTPILGLLLYFSGRMMERNANADSVVQPMRRWRLKSSVLALAGPVNLLFWLIFNQYLDRIGYRSVVGYILAGLVFLAGGLLTGLFSRGRNRTAGK